MKINEIKRGMSNISLTAKIIDISEPRDVLTKYGRRSVADATLEDETGQVSLSLWQDQINAVAVGDTVNITGAYATEFRDKLQLSIPRSGRIQVVEE
ncbi:MAG: OB-fold nucleic acid binding domain-containing protein [Candidatus Aenigmarchaeota archaeon]|nr:OB-fold nucleic acid binding domain-containing protein [Candidatus Aenigmarchaeota archaeon]